MQKLALLLLLSSVQVLAAGGAHHGEGVPTIVYWQAANLVIIFVALAYFAGPKIKETFNQRNADFLSSAEKSKAIQKEAEKKLEDIKNRLNHLERTSSESVARARAEAADLRQQIISEGQHAAEKIKREAQAVAQAEIQNAQRALHAQVVKESLTMAQEILKKDVGQGDQQRLQEQFGKQIEGVRL